MRIISPGRLPQKEYEATCSFCHTLFGFLEHEAGKKHPYESASFEKGWTWVVMCPLPGCGHLVWAQIRN
jgi:hypothetical protein